VITAGRRIATPARPWARALRLSSIVAVLAFLCGASGFAQSVRPKATVAAVTEHTSAAAGNTVRVALKVSLPEGLHTQSNKPRDPLLIPTELTVDAPAGITVKEIVWPASTDLKQAGQDQPLAVFEQTFAIGVQLAIAPTVAPAKYAVPLHLRYQACDANLCYPPSTASAPRRVAGRIGRTRAQ